MTHKLLVIATTSMLLFTAACDDDSAMTSDTGDAGSDTGDAGSDTGDAGSDTGDTGSSSDTGNIGSDTGDAPPACLSPEILTALTQHLTNIDFASYWLSGHSNATTAVGFLAAPGLPSELPPAVGAATFTLIGECTEAFSYDSSCWEGQYYCQQIECTGVGPGWEVHHWLDGNYEIDGWSFGSITVDSYWEDGWTGFTVALSSDATSPAGSDVSMSGEAWLGLEGFTLSESFPALHDDGPVLLDYADVGPQNAGGTLIVNDVVIATVDESGVWMNTPACDPT